MSSRGVEDRGDISRLRSLGQEYREIIRTPLEEIDGIEKGQGEGEGTPKRNGHSRYRMWIDPASPDRVECDTWKERTTRDNKLRADFLNLAHDKWKDKSAIPNWVELSAANTFVTNATLHTKLASRDLTPYYSEFMETHMNSPDGCATIEASFRWLGGSRRIGEIGRMWAFCNKYKRKLLTIYTYTYPMRLSNPPLLLFGIARSVSWRRPSGAIVRISNASTRAFLLR